jgi:hypothetical protein
VVVVGSPPQGAAHTQGPAVTSDADGAGRGEDRGGWGVASAASES